MDNRSGLNQQVAQLRAKVRRDRVKIRDLEKQVLLLNDQLETARLLAAGGGQPQVDLPVEVLDPGVLSEAATEVGAGDTDYQIVGVDSSGAEIVYMGAAAEEESISPKVTSSVRSRPRAKPNRSKPKSDMTIPDVPKSETLLVASAIPQIPRASRGTKSSSGTKSAPQANNSARTKRAISARSKQSPEDEYKAYYVALRAGNHQDAIDGFRSFVKRYPRHIFADNAQYWLGEAFYDQKQYDRALKQFKLVIRNYPRGNKAPDAQLKTGFCYLAIGELDKARGALNRVVEKYSKTRSADLARRRLEQLAVQ